MYSTKSWMLLVVALFVLPQFVEAQWVMAAHAAKNRIQQMKQKSGNGGYDVAIVLLEAAPTAVYDKTLKTLQTHPEIKITKNDSKNGRIEISKDQLVAGFQITALGDKLTQLVIASNLSEKAEPSPTSMVVGAVLRVCEQVNVKCSVEQN
jgi:hypothetical protein